METSQYIREKLVFPFVLSLFLLLAILFGATYLFVYILAALAVLFLLLSPRLAVARVGKYKKLHWLWSIFFFCLLVSGFFSHNLPASLDSFLFFAGGCLVFYAVLLSKQNYFSKNVLLFFLQAVVYLLAVISLLLTLFPVIATLPRSNQLALLGGHSHTGYVILLFLPYFWHSWKHAKRKLGHSFILAVLYFALVASKGRLIIFLTGLQTFGIWLLYCNRRTAQKKTQNWFILCSAVGLLVLFAAVASIPFLPQQVLPAPVRLEPRPLYWQQARLAIQSNLIFGYGPGTFSLISHKFAQFPHAFSGYAHNTVVQYFAELGVFGGISFSVLFAYLFYIALKQKNSTLLLLSLQTSVFVAFFDFDWHLAGYFYLVLVVLALPLREQRSFEQARSTSVLLRFMLLALAISSIVIAGLILTVESKVFQGKYDAAWEIFPYFSYHRLLFQSNITSKKSLQEFEKVYQFHPEVVATAVTNPWRALTNWTADSSSTLTADQATLLAQRLLAAQKYSYTPEYSQQVALAYELARLSGPDNTLLQLVYSLDSWVLQNAPVFSQEAILAASCKEVSDLFTMTNFVAPTQFGNRRYLFLYVFNLLANKAMTNNDMSFAQKVVERMFALAPDDYWVSQQQKNFPQGYWQNSREITNSSATQLRLRERAERCLE
ncbi:MAG: hypothetical protein A3A82_02810 [Candidatus Pacebacteria bacterium RIFCSPLOWO2_01_FULL_47_12]|nr:MAG: hypothetical protein A3J60_01660 [Candidatus Pacebacteria bacterium RIFCSPHIGHO2_02_FULL_46_9]OGJ37410.1 MAG: hypothetical protein A3A82_02810 [Candidatus Pacebacteria bacterium RIFCSPLOWO2_01_FULL_47_12]